MGKIGAVILAAGSSSRLGQAKQLLELNGEALVRRTMRSAREGGCEIVCIVTGDRHDEVARAVGDSEVLVLRNESWTRGIGSSIRTGVDQLSATDTSAIVLLACDQPALDSGTIRRLIETFEETGKTIVASHYADTLGIPALFARQCFIELQHLRDDRGAKEIIEAEPARVARIEFPGGELDLDIPADLEAWRERCSTGAHE